MPAGLPTPKQRHWAGALIEELRQIDRDEAPHGLYGLRESRRAGERLPKLCAILTASPIQLLKRMGVAQHVVRPSADYLIFGLGARRWARVDLESYADTKVRKFGDTFRLDKRSAPAERPGPDLPSLLPKLARRVFENHGNQRASFGLLLISHCSKERELHQLIDPMRDPAYLQKHGLLQCGEIWRDVHGRDFWSTAQLWYVEQE